jgi:RND family efflux transporter MFP subunit
LISSQVSAKVKAIHYREGETVPMGALLITLDDRELRSEVGKLEATRKRIQADLDYWKRQADRDEKLLIVNAISAQKRDESKRMVASLEASFQVNEYALASANIKLEYTRIHAPFYGAIQRLDTEVGEVATQGKVLMEFVATRSLKAVFSVPQKDIAELTPHADKHSLETEQDNGSIPNEQATIVKLTVPYLNKTIHSHIAHVYPALDAGTRNATFDVPLPENVEGLRHGMTADALVTLSKFEQALVVPRSSIRMHEGKPGVYTIEKNTAHWKPVTMGETQDTHVRVVSGIKVGETVIVTPDPRLQDGCRVQINKPWHSDL